MMVAIVPEVLDIRFEDIPNTLEALQDQVGGYIETVRLATDILAIVNEEGRLIGLPKNRHLTGIVEPMVLVHNEGGDPEFHGLTEADMVRLQEVFGGIKNTAAAVGAATTEEEKIIRDHDTLICKKSQIRQCGDAHVLDGKRYLVCLVPEELLK